MIEDVKPEKLDQIPLQEMRPPRVIAGHPLRSFFTTARKHWIIASVLGVYLLFKLLGAAWNWILTPRHQPAPTRPDHNTWHVSVRQRV